MVSKTPQKTIDVADFPITLTFALTIATQQTAVEVTGKRSPFANSDPNYVALRNADPGAAYGVANLTLFDQLDFVVLGPPLHTALLIKRSACFRASGVSSCPDSIRPTSRVRPARSSSSIPATVRPSLSRFSTQ